MRTVDERALDAAAGWHARLGSGRASDSERREFDAWIDAAPEHQDAWARTQNAWALVGELADHPALAQARRSARRPPASRLWAPVAIAASLAAAVALGLTWKTMAPPISPPAGEVQLAAISYMTPVGKVSRIALSDGTIVMLDADSAMSAVFDGKVRRVTLSRGRAQFQVAHDAAHPFVVTAQGRSVTALGTVFDVDLEPAAVTVTLLQGKVAVRDLTARQDARQAILTPGERLVASGDGGWSRRAIDTTQAARWLNGDLVFDESELGLVAAELNRYSNRKLVLADARLIHTPISGVFRAGDPEALAEGLEASGVARVTRRASDQIVLSKP
ncbi:FecR family protein [Caulobacter soli]|uniref:FecR family protein n=1 Tax=Caulobacter soli TaxID=2708539 RepID=UPI0013ED021D|nr:FecR domain-containing protein [Caulobacter soli]